ncbi:hypothetical protein FA15DRAFT_62470 [Coprinopsis marcescibilis]|uniref:Uncharacterized protein n=1 Tax=Coprinopsis marcescibilis TaxID=230819 RepID=A0A5C3KNT0_COPMA|nr:hypothetical protein FA15DRAFT_62470 [Coprinopsis marcescibilis]
MAMPFRASHPDPEMSMQHVSGTMELSVPESEDIGRVALSHHQVAFHCPGSPAELRQKVPRDKIKSKQDMLRLMKSKLGVGAELILNNVFAEGAFAGYCAVACLHMHSRAPHLYSPVDNLGASYSKTRVCLVFLTLFIQASELHIYYTHSSSGFAGRHFGMLVDCDHAAPRTPRELTCPRVGRKRERDSLFYRRKGNGERIIQSRCLVFGPTDAPDTLPSKWIHSYVIDQQYRRPSLQNPTSSIETGRVRERVNP